jgi:alanyl-tRNA synthetase
MTSNEIRAAFLEYFQSKGHEVVPGSPLIPANDPTLLFTNAGMVQFKELFLGKEARSYTRAASSQRCIRAGGKHNDLDNVGYTARHHTFFEMLGNFSFGDYFKNEAINYAWEFLTKVLEIPEQRLWITVFEDDDEAADIWLNEVGIDKGRFSRCGEEENFWAMGDTGPCGPCSEIFYDHGEEVTGGPPGSPDAEGDRYVEIWNLVFTQYDRSKDGILTAIPKPSVDTGMGLERIAAVKLGVHSNYDIDIFRGLITAIQRLSSSDDAKVLVSHRVIADHIRSCAFLIADGVVPSNEGRGYVLRRIIRRAIRHGSKLEFNEPFFYQLVEPLIEVMGDSSDVLRERKEFVEDTLLQEEQRFAETLDHGLRHLEEALAKISGDTIPGDVIFKLYDTYGFPVDLTADIARERQLQMDMAGFEREMENQRQRARAASKFDVDMSVNQGGADYTTEFSGYEKLQDSSIVSAIFKDGGHVNEVSSGDKAGIILESTPFYAESGGQVGDSGNLSADGIHSHVTDTQKQGKAHIHLGVVENGTIKEGQSLIAEVDNERRIDIIRNHSATHLLHAALRKILGSHVSQKGSLVAHDRLRFDFSHPKPITPEELIEIETLVNRKILDNQDTNTEVMALEEAKKSGAMSLFGEKYDEKVRVLNIGEGFSIELCGGTHVLHSGDIGLFKITTETGIAAGVRRIEAVTGEQALAWVRESEICLNRIAGLLKTDHSGAEGKLEQLLDKTRKQEKEIDRLKVSLASSTGTKSLRNTVDQLKNKLGTGVILLATVNESKVSLVAGVTKDITDRIKAGDLVNFAAEKVGGRGGGRADMAQAGGNDPSGLEDLLNSAPQWVEKKLVV